MQSAQLALTADGIPYSTAFDDVYHTADGGIAQAQHVFMAGNDLPGRWRKRRAFTICETGFGLGLSFIATWAAWRADEERSERLHFVSCELHPFTATDLTTLYTKLFANEPALLELGTMLIQAWPMLMPGIHRLELDGGRVTLTLLLGDALYWLTKLTARVDAFYLDGFSPSKNPTLWQLPLYKQFTRLAANGATLATYTVAGDVRRGLETAGFTIERQPGFGSKRQMLVGQFKGFRQPDTTYTHRHAIVVGAGIAGSAIAERLAARGWRITMLERHPQPAQEASGNLAGAYRPVVSSDDNNHVRLVRACFLYGLGRLKHLSQYPGLHWSQCGALQLARTEDEAERFKRLAEEQDWPSSWLRAVSRQEASELAGLPVAASGLWFPLAGWINPPSLVDAQLDAAGSALEQRYGCELAKLVHENGEWQAYDDQGHSLTSAPVLILANAAETTRFAPELLMRGDSRLVSHLPSTIAPDSKTVVCLAGYLTPNHQGVACLGSSPLQQQDEPADGHAANLAILQQMFDPAPAGLDANELQGRLCARPSTIDRLPIVGPLGDPATFQTKHTGSLHLAPRRPGLYALTGFGARGLVWSGLMAELLASQIEGEPLPLERELVNAIDPARFLGRQLEQS
ncbi:bifunctional tRNA (5-methylaminomethyl-2-thiouridine)(34)-methyltransferase MnmD/FAD-dependent 5-carboxymethylaminomethyl-2-thiouridine(34) oxidoreductase MnmC [Chitinimonas sp. BJB300]|nr:bifunctional tRNA (5-methylaminomethyl-2-thiouridine)(34)-methyltransferase MnmD/FAD-dependent 5-carboxymethylaminomethyl-2-thiouridine(34) oxidoreductase MnmC [Chitinimonas sp. BJB300]TSJ87188.1 bifunctional tRNA (5-methylaminomethyl-2-thiouridine)(34)-methyltransferase MnmD/FAD-dependent 5-carboxymethylaminomethyl-2-thiouridine(34) oxidoreductase MnmC [Chitinimonas sp. BJB300]